MANKKERKAPDEKIGVAFTGDREVETPPKGESAAQAGRKQRHGMKYVAFKIVDGEGINAFLEKNDDYIASDGIAYLDGSICFIYDDRTADERERDGMVASCKKVINERLAETLGADLDERYWRRMSIQGYPGAHKGIEDGNARKRNLLTQIDKLREMLKEIQAGTWCKEEQL